MRGRLNIPLLSKFISYQNLSSDTSGGKYIERIDSCVVPEVKEEQHRELSDYSSEEEEGDGI